MTLPTRPHADHPYPHSLFPPSGVDPKARHDYRSDMKRPPLNTYLFDLDGTLIDSIELILMSYRHTLERHRASVPPDDVWLSGLGTPLRAQLAEFANDPAELEGMVQTYRDYNHEHHDRLVREFPGARQVVQSLKDRGARLGIVTSKMRAGSLRGLTHCGLDDLFEVLVAADDLEKHKPDPAPVLKALELLDSDPTGAVFIGDSPHDLAAGQAAGVRTAAALWGAFSRRELAPHRPHYWLARLRDIMRME